MECNIFARPENPPYTQALAEKLHDFKNAHAAVIML